jgi:hypothetical protein
MRVKGIDNLVLLLVLSSPREVVGRNIGGLGGKRGREKVSMVCLRAIGGGL